MVSSGMVIAIIAFFGCFILSGLFAIFISTRKWPWQLRTIILILSVLPLHIIQAPDLLLILLVSQLFVLAAIQYERTRRLRFTDDSERRRRVFFVPNFNLSTFVSLFLLIGFVLAITSQTLTDGALREPHINFSSFPGMMNLVAIGIALGVWSLTPLALSHWKIKTGKKVVLILLALSASLVCAALDDQWISPGSTFVIRLLTWKTLLGLVLVTIATLLFVFNRTFGQSANAVREGSWLRHFRFLRPLGYVYFVTLSGLLAGSVGYLYFKLSIPPPAAANRTVLDAEEPNGVVEFVDAAKRLDSSQILNGNLWIKPGKSMRREIDKYDTAFKTVDRGLTRKTQTWIDWSNLRFAVGDLDYFGDLHSLNLPAFRTVSRALSAKARQERYEGNWDDSIEDGLRTVRMVNSLTNEGVLLTALIGAACESSGYQAIQLSLKNASSQKLERAARTLDELSNDPVTLDQIMQNERWLIWNQNDWRFRTIMVMMPELLEAAKSNVKDALVRRNATRDLLRAEIAAERYFREHQTYPVNLQELVPKFLDSVPLDAFSDAGKNLRYRAANDRQNCRIYSVGPDRQDDGGQIDPAGNDLKLDFNLREMAERDEADILGKLVDAETLLGNGEALGQPGPDK